MAYDVGQALFLRQHGLTNEEIARRMGVSPAWVSKRLPKLRREYNWTEDEIDQLSAMLERGMPIKHIAARLDRTAASCRVKICRMTRAANEDPEIRLICQLVRKCRDQYGMKDAGAILRAIRESDVLGRVIERWKEYGWM